MTQTILLAPDSFKGSLSAADFCELAQQTIERCDPSIEVIKRPLSDGGEGFVDAFIIAGIAERQTRIVQDPLGRPIKADFAWQPENQTAIIEMAQASGLPCLSTDERNPFLTSTYGTGQLLSAAIEMSAKKIIVGLGGSATQDGGMGALQALGVNCVNTLGDPIEKGANGLSELAKIEQKQPGLAEIEWIIACDVTNPLLGEKGSTRVFAPQKGATNDNLASLEASMTNLATQLSAYYPHDIGSLPGGGAAGGMAASFVAILGARLVSGFDLLSDTLQLPQLFQTHKIDLVITGEGAIDEQSQYGKLPFRMAQLAQENQVPTVALCGKLNLNQDTKFPFKQCFSIHPDASKLSLADAFSQTPRNLAITLENGLFDWLG
ncbi:glycerate kinase [Hydrogenovibrio sp. SC-1]|uniref:glycerate kinase n=1 Tax=Hydrogenovibrio sp. SC-1 TaxID=2065820 RepID=UPI000C7D80F6|nr:glycerate kinase [Hydrogenovibrio sp. SC-1]PLA74212.1 glycerate kinase [Hydrogenovibrio sp. SC-1]